MKRPNTYNVKPFLHLLPLVLSGLMISSGLATGQRGLTGIDPTVVSEPIITQPATLITAPVQPEPKRFDYTSPWFTYTDDWMLIASDSVSFFIPEGDHFAISFDPLTETLELIDPNAELSATQTAAIDRAPAWLRADLYDNFRRFDYPIIADWVADEILNAPDPYVDEVAFQAAHIAPGLLGGVMYLELLLENVEWVYAVDSSLHFVDLVDYGDSGDDDYWTTAVYTIVEEGGDTIQVEVDRDIYYWYVVHPKLSDEVPTYIDPQTGNPANPPVGVFWRTYLWNHADPGYPLFSEQWGGCDVYWNRTGAGNDAISTTVDWINNVMTFGAGAERPIQPVRIYTLHCGNCGEFSDITAAAGRIALIPTVCTTNFCEDHTWNEFWEREWIHWEPVNNYVNSPLVYENGWGKILSAVFNWRGDGSVWTVTDRYSEGVCTLNVSVYDSLGKPADSERIIIQSNALWGGMYYATWGVTNSEGQVSFVLGDEESFYLRIDGPLGGFPTSGYTWVVGNTQAGAVYDWEHTFSAYTPNIDVSEAPEYPNPLDDYLMEITYECEYQTDYAEYFTNNDFGEKRFPGLTDVFVVNDSNFTAYTALEPALGFGFENNIASGSISFVLPTDDVWYGVFSSRELSLSRPRINAVVSIYRNSVQDVSISMTPYNPPITIPASGGDFDFNVALANNEASAVTFDAWIMVQLPDSNWFGPVLGPVNLSLTGGSSLDRDRTQNVPAGAPNGIYTYEGRIGMYPDDVWASDSFIFEKLTTGDGSTIYSWANNGEGFEIWQTAVALEIPSEVALHGAYPNPFNHETAISFAMPFTGRVKISVYNLLGQEVAVLTDKVYSTGEHAIRWNGHNHYGELITSGIYLIRLSSDDSHAVQKVCYMR